MLCVIIVKFSHLFCQLSVWGNSSTRGNILGSNGHFLPKGCFRSSFHKLLWPLWVVPISWSGPSSPLPLEANQRSGPQITGPASPSRVCAAAPQITAHRPIRGHLPSLGPGQTNLGTTWLSLQDISTLFLICLLAETCVDWQCTVFWVYNMTILQQKKIKRNWTQISVESSTGVL